MINGDFYKVSCVFAFYEGGSVVLLASAIESILCQTVAPSEIILVIDGPLSESKDSALKEMLRILENRNAIPIEIVRLPINGGPGVARDVGIRKANSRFVAVMDADDISVPERFELQINAFKEDSDLSVVGGTIMEDISGRLRTVPLSPDEIRKTIRIKCPINNMTVMIKRQAYLEVGGYPGKRTSEDYELWGRFVSKGYKIINLPNILVHANYSNGADLRRLGLKVFRDDLKTQQFLLTSRCLNHLEFFRNLVLYFVFRMSPRQLLSFYYRFFLRR
ncbi:MAG TPA: hypothetical protein DCG52_03360 [Alphaproteobacteria bacterium]|nr:hypothetical protein [Alphaproteobacteria bacterium]|tara:strand:+ start:3051 stop:3881 length:831 start_codon:yes stop_codon:yes gene_type:complete